MTTTLPLFWKLSSHSRQERIDASVKLVGALEQFQSSFVPLQTPPECSSEEDEDGKELNGSIQKKDEIDNTNAPDVSYSIRRLVRGLASPRESSRLGFAVALTELLSRLDTITASQILTLISQTSQIYGSTKGQEERDLLFARLFGIASLTQSGLLFRTTPLAMSSIPQCTFKDFQGAMEMLLVLPSKKSFLKEPTYWVIILTLHALAASKVDWKDDAWTWIIQKFFLEDRFWSPEKIGVVITLQNMDLVKDWKTLLCPPFKNADILSTANLTTLAKVLREAEVEEPDVNDLKSKSIAPWKPQLHFVWNIILDIYFSPKKKATNVKHKATFPEFFKTVVDESLFAPTSSDGRKLWGFELFRLSITQVPLPELPRLFTPNFMRSWVNHLSKPDRYLHKAAKLVASSLPPVVTANPSIGLPVLLQLLQTQAHFDRLTKTKTVESLLAVMDVNGVEEYVSHLGELATRPSPKVPPTNEEDFTSIRVWVADQFSMLIRNGAIPKADAWIIKVLQFLLFHGLFSIRKKCDKSEIEWLRNMPEPAFSDSARSACRTRLLSCLAELTSQSTIVTVADKTVRRMGCASDGEFWISKVHSNFVSLEKDTKHVARLSVKEEDSEKEREIRGRALQTIEKLKIVNPEKKNARDGAELLLAGTVLYQYLSDDIDADNDDMEACVTNIAGLFLFAKPHEAKEEGDFVEDVTPITAIVDIIIGYLEKSSGYLRSIANQSFSFMTNEVDKATLDLILAQLERRDPTRENGSDEEAMEEDEGGQSPLEDKNVASTDEESGEEEEEEEEEEEDPELRRKIKEALRSTGAVTASEASDVESQSNFSDDEVLDDDQMMALDAHLTEIFRSRAKAKGKGGAGAQREATHFKNRVLDLVDIFLRKEPLSPFTIAFPVPLLQMIMGAGPDEKQFSDKAKGVLRSRFSKAKEIPATVETETTRSSLQELHSLARKVQASDVRDIISGCSLYFCRILLSDSIHDEKTVIDAYRTSLSDFALRKSSPLQPSFVQEFVKRQPRLAWQLRDDILQLATKAVNDYRICQTFLLFQPLFAQLGNIGSNSDTVSIFCSKFCQQLVQMVTNACDDPELLNTSQVKELLKLLLSAIRQTQRIFGDKHSPRKTWAPAAISSLSKKLQVSRFQNSNSLLSICQQTLAALNLEDANGDIMDDDHFHNDQQKKRKNNDTNDGARKPKRKKVKKKHHDTVNASGSKS